MECESTAVPQTRPGPPGVRCGAVADSTSASPAIQTAAGEAPRPACHPRSDLAGPCPRMPARLEPDTVASRRRLDSGLPRRARRGDALREPRRAELPPRRGDHGRPRDPRQLHRHAERGQAQRVESAALLLPRLGLGKGVRHRRIRAALALGPLRPRHRSGRLRDRHRALEQARRADRGGPGRRQPDADLVLAGGPLLRGAGLLLRRLAALLRPRPAHRQRARSFPLGARLGTGPLQPLLRRLRGRDRGRLAARRPSLALVDRRWRPWPASARSGSPSCR